MSKFSHADLLSLHAEMSALAEAGVEFDADLGGSPQAIRATLESCAAVIAERVRQGLSFEDAILDGADLPPSYRTMVQVGLRTGRLVAPLAQGECQAAAAGEVRNTLQRAIIYPAILCAFAIVGAATLCLIYLPTFEALYDQTRETPDASVQLLAQLRSALPWWGPLALVGLAGGVWLWRRFVGNELVTLNPRFGWLQRLFGVRHYLAMVEQSLLARQVAELLQSGTARDESLRLAKISRNPTLTSQLRPFLQWTLTSPLDDRQLASTLHIVADMYWQSSQRSSVLLRALVPTIFCAVIGGAAALGYGLLVFSPFVALLHSLAE